jgi:serine/threonine protein kinase
MGNICGTEDAEPPNPHRIDLTHFDLLKVVGKGGFGKVNAIQRRDTSQELCALKRMAKAAVIKKESHIRMVWTERNIMSQVTGSPFLVHLYHAFQTETELLFVMPFMQGGDLRYYMSQRGPIPEADCLFYAAELLLALEYMHKKHIAYRDLKPYVHTSLPTSPSVQLPYQSLCLWHPD